MLKVLRRIVQELNASQDLDRALHSVVSLVKESVETDACSVFLVEESAAEYVLVASDGAFTSRIGELRINLGQTLVGYVGEKEEPVNIDNVLEHPRYSAISEDDVERFHAFLGVPILHQRELLGVLIVQQEEARSYDDSEVAFLVTLAAQLAGIIAHAKVSGVYPTLGATKKEPTLKGKIFSGVSGATGVAIGKAVVVYPPADLDAVPERQTEETEEELQKFSNAIKAAKKQVKQLSKTLSSNLPVEEQTLFEVYIKILESRSLRNEIRKEIRQKYTAEAAVKRVFNRRIAQFDTMEDAYLAERATDMKDLGQRILFQLQSGVEKEIDYPKRTILIGEEVSAAALAEVPEKRLAGVISAKGSASSHVAILARALGVPTAMGVGGIPLSQIGGKEIIIDGYYGQVYVEPVASIRKEFRGLLKEEQELDAKLNKLRDLPAETLDGHSVDLMVNTGLAADTPRALDVGAKGVGLYRTEVPFMVRERFPSEEEQREIYEALLKSFTPGPVMMRTLDIGGDKSLPYFPIEEENPSLGWRGIRVTLDHPDIFLVQLRAMLRASVGHNNLNILLPMVSSIAEIEAAMRLISQAHAELIEEGEHVVMPGVGVMVELPAAVYQARELAKRVDFLSVGSNDLTQYILAVDRNNSLVSGLYDALHPAVLQALMQVVTGAKKERKRVSICGELAGDPVAVVLLLAMGFDSLSVNASILPRVKWVVRNFTFERATELLNEVLAMDDPIEIRCHMELALEEAGLAGLIRAGK